MKFSAGFLQTHRQAVEKRPSPGVRLEGWVRFRVRVRSGFRCRFRVKGWIRIGLGAGVGLELRVGSRVWLEVWS